MFLFYSISAILCFATFCLAHYQDLNQGMDLEVSDVVFTVIVSFLPFINVFGLIYALAHVTFNFGFFDWLGKILTTTVIKGKQ